MAQLSTPLDARPLVPGDVVPDAPITLRNGEAGSLRDLRGSPIVLTFHAPHWDPAHREQIAAYNRLIASLPDGAGAQLLSAGGDELWHEFIFDDATVALQVLSDANEDLAPRFGVRDEPAVFVIDRDGVIRWRHVGTEAPDTGDIVHALTEAAHRAPN